MHKDAEVVEDDVGAGTSSCPAAQLAEEPAAPSSAWLEHCTALGGVLPLQLVCHSSLFFLASARDHSCDLGLLVLAPSHFLHQHQHPAPSAPAAPPLSEGTEPGNVEPELFMRPPRSSTNYAVIDVADEVDTGSATEPEGLEPRRFIRSRRCPTNYAVTETYSDSGEVPEVLGYTAVPVAEVMAAAAAEGPGGLGYSYGGVADLARTKIFGTNYAPPGEAYDAYTYDVSPGAEQLNYRLPTLRITPPPVEQPEPELVVDAEQQSGPAGYTQLILTSLVRTPGTSPRASPRASPRTSSHHELPSVPPPLDSAGQRVKHWQQEWCLLVQQFESEVTSEGRTHSLQVLSMLLEEFFYTCEQVFLMFALVPLVCFLVR
jgi:hypothetical protein